MNVLKYVWTFFTEDTPITVKVRDDNVLKMVPIPSSGSHHDFKDTIRNIHNLYDRDFTIKYQDPEGDIMTLGDADRLTNLATLRTIFEVTTLDTKPMNDNSLLMENESMLVMASKNESENFEVMLSYSWVHQSVVLRIKSALEERNFTVWMDVDKMHGNINGSKQCKKELNLADESDKVIVPVRLDMGPFTWSRIICARILYLDLVNVVDEVQWQIAMNRFAEIIRSAIQNAPTGSLSPKLHPSTATPSTFISAATMLPSSLNDLKLWLIPEDLKMEEDISELIRKSLPTTRRWLMDEVDGWQKSTDQTLWITGVAETGKSIIASIDTKRNTADRVLVTFAYQLAQVFQSVLIALHEVQTENPDIVSATSIHLLFKELIVLPLSRVTPSEQRDVVVVLDAVDECGTYNSAQRRDLLYIIYNWSNLPKFVKLVWTSRPDGDILEAMKTKIMPKWLHLDDLRQREDLMKYAVEYMNHLGDRLSSLTLAEIEILTVKLVDNAAGLFVWLFLACEQIRLSFDPADELQSLVILKSGRPYDSMANIYSLTLDRAYQGLSDTFIAIGNQVLGIIVAAKKPISDVVIAELLQISLDEIRIIIRAFRSVLVISDDQVQVLHKSFSDFLRTTLSPYRIDEVKVHLLITGKCLNVLNKSLKFNILGLHADTFHNEIANLNDLCSCIGSHVEYAAAFWILHLIECKIVTKELMDSITTFAKSHLLHWLEMLSLIGQLNKIPTNTADLLDFMEKDQFDDLRMLFVDLRRISMEFQPAISANCLQVYVSALSFCPKNTSLYNQYKHTLNKPRHFPVLVSQNSQSWNACISSKFHDRKYGVCNSICWALDTQLVSGCDDGVVCIFDFFGGTVLHELFGHESPIRAVVSASPHGKIVASGSDDGFIIVWNEKNSFYILGTHAAWVTAVAISFDGKWTASEGTDAKIQVWDHAGGALLDLAKL
ncbi:hypothetical protein HK100_008463 [Physocladia obscura]|uniref:Nephrocystin 3-like N-terminal domain-containing protein n=1 Tax=Physocladia obscura TaxID=109957 RepID=A0AAD5T6K0_9FUNG|nr:hypothetical protein HK100_008463 [Physocladia obscura]